MYRRLFALITSALLAGGVLCAQQQPSLTTKQISLQLQTPPAPVSSAGAAIVGGQTGPATYYYWIVSTYTIGNSSPFGPVPVAHVPSTLSVSAYVQISWTAQPGALSFDVLRTTSTTAPTAACNCAVATGVTSTSADDQSNALAAYTIATLDPDSVTSTLQSEPQGAAQADVILRTPGRTAVDLSITGSMLQRAQVNAVLDCGVLATSMAQSAAALNACIVAHKGWTIVLPKLVAWGSTSPDLRFTNVTPIVMTGNGTRLVGSAAGSCSTQACATHILFDSGVAQGISLLNNLCQNCSVEGLEIQGSDPFLPTDSSTAILPAASCNTTSYGTGITGTSTSDGIAVGSVFVTLRNLVVYGFGRFGVNLNGYGPPNYADNVHLENVLVTNNRGSGYCAAGTDSNAISTLQLRSYSNQIGGIEDYSFLGTAHYSPEAHSNHMDVGSTNGPNLTISNIVGIAGTVTATVTPAPNASLKIGNVVVISGTTNFNGSFFVATVSATQFTFALGGAIPAEAAGTAKRATITQAWAAAGATSLANVGFGYRATGGAVRSVWINPYCEIDNPPAQFNLLTHILVGGDMGCGYDVAGGNAPSEFTTTTAGMEIRPGALFRNRQVTGAPGNNGVWWGSGWSLVEADNGFGYVTTNASGQTTANTSDFRHITDGGGRKWVGWRSGSTVDGTDFANYTLLFEMGVTGGQAWARNGLRFGGTTGPIQITGNVDPSAGAGTAAPRGSVYMRTNGGATSTLYFKNGAADTDWTAAGAGGGGLPLTTLGDIVFENATPTPDRLPGNTDATRKFLRQLGTGAISAAPAWDTVTATDVGLANVTNDAQTKASIFPNTAPTAGQIGVGNAGGTAYAAVSLSSDCTLASTGAITCSHATAADSATTAGTITGALALGNTPLTTLGDLLYANASPTLDRLAGNTNATRKFLRQLGTGVISAAPAWDTVTATDVGLSNVTNDAQTKASIFPNTAPTAGQIGVGNAGGTAYATVSLSNDCTLASTGAITCTKTNGTAFGDLATKNLADALHFTGSPVTIDSLLAGGGCTNDTSTGTVNARLAKLEAGNKCILIGTSDTDRPLLLTVYGGATSGVSYNAGEAAIAPLDIDNATTVGDAIAASTGTAGKGHDAGTMAAVLVPTASTRCFIGTVMSTNGGAGQYNVEVSPFCVAPLWTVAVAQGGTGSAFFAVAGPASSVKTFTFPNASATITYTVGSGTLALATSAISANSCQTVTQGSVNSAAATGTLTTDTIEFTPNATIKAVTGYTPAGTLTIVAYPTADYVNFDVCNKDQANPVTPGAVTLNWSVRRP